MGCYHQSNGGTFSGSLLLYIQKGLQRAIPKGAFLYQPERLLKRVMTPPQTITMTIEGIQAQFWVVTFMEVFADGSTITKYGMYSYN